MHYVNCCFRLKVHTLEKCEDVLQKMYEKMESVSIFY